ncbi:MAG TPA: hypothetical protein VMT52_00600 [Planctomycetota bacterium]|nr:hypothetical protein [Planctomycetota bacterium]
MRLTRVLPGRVLFVAVLSLAGDPLAGEPASLEKRRRARGVVIQAAREPSAPVLGRAGGRILTALSRDEARRARTMLLPGDGGGASIQEMAVFQTRFLDSGCAFPEDCPAPCNVVLLVWQETTANPDGVRIVENGQLIGTIAGLGALELPGLNGVNILGVPPGPTVYTLEDVAGGTTDGATITVLDTQPFKDPRNVSCKAGNAGPQGTCELLGTWTVGTRTPDVYRVFIDGTSIGTRPGQAGEIVIQSLAPGNHTLLLQGITDENEKASYLGCPIETSCSLTCEDTPCDPPTTLGLCQASHGEEGLNTVRASWLNGEDPYPFGVNGYVDGVLLTTLPTDPEEGSPDVAFFGGLNPGEHTLGIQGNCEDESVLSSILEGTINLLTATPHTSPITGDAVCTFNPGSMATTVTWTPGDPSLFIDVYILEGENLFFAGTADGRATSLEVTGTNAAQFIVLQFFANLGGECHGSALIRCVPRPPQRNQYIQGLCNGEGGATGHPQITSSIFGLAYLFSGGPAPPCTKACDANGDGGVDISDMVYILTYLFAGGQPPTSWQDSDGDGNPEPTCTPTEPEDDCETPHDLCSG